MHKTEGDSIVVAAPYSEADAPQPVVNRRAFLKGGVAGAASISFRALLARTAAASPGT